MDARNDVAACMRIFFALHNTPQTGSNDDNESRHAGVLIERVLDWAVDHDWFDTSFVESLREGLEKWGRLTSRQLGALENTIDQLDIP